MRTHVGKKHSSKQSHRGIGSWGGLESLEGRLLLSGNVTAVLRGPTLLITGDRQDNSISVAQNAGGFVITGAAGTTVNGSTDPVTVTGNPRNLIFNMGRGGNNTVTVDGALTVSGELDYRGGSGDDVFDCSSATVQALAASGDVVFTTVPAQSADGQVVFTPVVGQAAAGDVVFTPVVGQAATGDVVFTPVVGQAATGDVVFTPVVGQAATGQIVFDPNAVTSDAATADIILEANPVDGDAVIVNDGINAPVTFTFRDTPVDPTDVQIGAAATDSTTNLASAISGAGLALTAAVTDVTTVTLTADTVGARPAWDVASVSANITTSNVFQGTDPNLVDGNTVTVNDGINAPVTFTFRDTPVDPTDVQIGATATDSMANLAGIVNGAGLALTAEAIGDTVTVTADATGLRGAWALDVVGDGLSAQNVSQGVTAVDNVVDGNTVTVNDGINAPVTFTFRDTPVDPTDVQIGATSTDSMANLAGIVNGAGLALTAVASGDTVTLTADATGLRGAWALDVVGDGLSAQNVSQGTVDVENVVDGNTVTVNDGINAPVTFTFRDTPVDPTDVQIGATAADSMANLAGIVNGAGLALTAVANGDTVTVTADATGLRTVWALDVVGDGLSVQNVSQGTVDAENVVDGNTVTVNDGINAPVTFTFRDTPVDPTDVQIGATSADSMANLANIVNGAGLALTAVANGDDVTVTADATGLRTAWALDVVGDGLSVQNVSQGATDAENVVDGDTVTINDGVNPVTTFTFRDTPVGDLDVQIGATAADSMTNLATVLNGDGDSDADDLAITAVATGDTVTVTANTTGLRSTWAISVVDAGLSVQNVSQGADAVDNVVDGDTVTIDDGVNPVTTFTFRDTPVGDLDVQIGATAADSMTNLATVLNGDGDSDADDLAITAQATGDTVTVTANTTGLRSTWAISVVGDGLTAQNVSQGANGESLPAVNVGGDLEIFAGKGNNSVLLGSVGGPAGQISVGRQLLITSNSGADTVTVRNANVVGGPTRITVGAGDGEISLIDDVFGPSLAGKLQKVTVTSGSGADFLTVTGCDFSGFASFNLGKGANTAQIGSSLFESGESITNAFVQFV